MKREQEQYMAFQMEVSNRNKKEAKVIKLLLNRWIIYQDQDQVDVS